MVFLVVKNNSTPLYVLSEGSRVPTKFKIGIAQKLHKIKNIFDVKIYRSSMFMYIINKIFFIIQPEKCHC